MKDKAAIQTTLKNAGILLVDDEPAVLNLLEVICKQAGFKYVHIANDGIQALKLLQRHSEEIDLVSLDCMMPSMSGIKVAEIVANTHDRIVGLVMVTGFGSEELKREFFSTGTNVAIIEQFVNKPFDTDSIIEIFAEAIRDVYSKREKQLDTGVSIALRQVKNVLVSNVEELAEIKENVEKIEKKIEIIEFKLNELKTIITSKGSSDANYVWALTFLFILVTGALAWASFYLPILSVLALASITIVVLMLIAAFDLSKGGKLSEKSLMEVLRRAFSFIGRKQK
jgi:CheY-like chemotaxis protein